MTNDFLKKLTLDFSNIDIIYSEYLKNYSINGINKTETIFIDSFDFDSLERSENSEKLSMYLGKKKSGVERYNIDYYNSYIETGRFGFAVFWNYTDHEFDKVLSDLNRNKERFDYVFDKLPSNSKIELKNDYCDRLEILKNRQSKTKFKEIIENLIIEINNDYVAYNQKTEVTEIINTTSTFDKTKAKDYKNENWFKTGIPLATGEAFDLYRKHKNDKGVFEIINKILGFKKNDRTFFSSTINDNQTVVNNNNTFAFKTKLQKLHKHLTENDMNFGAEFLIKYNEIEPE